MSVNWQIDHVFLLKPFLVKEVLNRNGFNYLAERLKLFVKVSSFQGYYPVWQGVVLGGLDQVLPYDLNHVGQ